MTTRHGLCISDFNVENFAALLRSRGSEDGFQIEVAPFGQVTQLLSDDQSSYWTRQWDFIVVWTRPEATLRSFQKLLHGESATESELAADVDAFAEVLKRATARANHVFTPTWSQSVPSKGRGLLDLRKGGVERALLQANLRLLERLDDQQQITPLNSARWFQTAGAKGVQPAALVSRQDPVCE